jgi:hypothetical protein
MIKSAGRQTCVVLVVVLVRVRTPSIPQLPIDGHDWTSRQRLNAVHLSTSRNCCREILVLLFLGLWLASAKLEFALDAVGVD